MRIAATAATLLLFALASCSTTNQNEVSPYQQPNQLMGTEITQRVQQIPFQHREELMQNLLWLEQSGEQAIPALLEGLENENAKVRSSCCWVLGRMRDRRTVPNLQALTTDPEDRVALEASRSLVLMGDIAQAPQLIIGLDSDHKEVRFLCHEALKESTGHDFGYDHLNQNKQDMQVTVLRWRQWWSEYSGDQMFALGYAQKHGLTNVAAPSGETQPQGGAEGTEAPSPSSEAGGEPTTETSTESTEGGEGQTPSQATPSNTGTSNTSTSNTGTSNTGEPNTPNTPPAPSTNGGNG